MCLFIQVILKCPRCRTVQVEGTEVDHCWPNTAGDDEEPSPRPRGWICYRGLASATSITEIKRECAGGCYDDFFDEVMDPSAHSPIDVVQVRVHLETREHGGSRQQQMREHLLMTVYGEQAEEEDRRRAELRRQAQEQTWEIRARAGSRLTSIAREWRQLTAELTRLEARGSDSTDEEEDLGRADEIRRERREIERAFTEMVLAVQLDLERIKPAGYIALWVGSSLEIAR
ncbi:hypothetical protein B0T19DRAFT_404012 [Cercophora scortea]|uniref:Uncharacterized protein n=1 Tax=Cercophora scortea TaxID=314031 RepID=A0AAE0IBY2_9PEZI|nr:hypothetical protein B0T19DRAFT_404012 [Cercophora scortea]